MFSSSFSRAPSLGAVVVYLACYSVALVFLGTTGGDDAWLDPLVSFGILGVIFPLLAFFLTRAVRPAQSPSAAPAAPAIVIYLAVFALGVLGYGFTAIHAWIKAEPALSLTLLVIKLITMVVLPALIVGWLAGGVRRWLATSWHTQWLWLPLIGIGIAMLAFQAVFGRGLTTLNALHLPLTTLLWTAPVCFLWLLFEVGITEEFLFRVALQTSLADRLRSPIAGVLVGALLFGLAHAPGLYLRGSAGEEGMDGPVTIGWAIAYSIAVISPSGIFVRHIVRRVVGTHAQPGADRRIACAHRSAAESRAVHPDLVAGVRFYLR